MVTKYLKSVVVSMLQAFVCEPLSIVNNYKRKIGSSTKSGDNGTMNRYVINCTRVTNPNPRTKRSL